MKYFFVLLLCFPLFSSGQTKPLDHSVYDNWRSAGERAISPDGKRIVFPSARDGDLDIYLMNADGTGAAKLTDDASYNYGAEWSPDGSMIAFNHDDEI